MLISLPIFNHRHFSVAKLEAAQRDLIDRFHRFTLPRYWGDGKTGGCRRDAI